MKEALENQIREIALNKDLKSLMSFISDHYDWLEQNLDSILVILSESGWLRSLKVLKAMHEDRFIATNGGKAKNFVPFKEMLKNGSYDCVNYMIHKLSRFPAPTEYRELINFTLQLNKPEMLSVLISFPKNISNSKEYSVTREIKESIKEFADQITDQRMSGVIKSQNLELPRVRDTKDQNTTEEMILEYLFTKALLKPNKNYDFIFYDGTGFIGCPKDYAKYFHRRIQVFPDDTYEINPEWDFGIPDENPDDSDMSGVKEPVELYFPQYAGDSELNHRGRMDPRF